MEMWIEKKMPSFYRKSFICLLKKATAGSARLSIFVVFKEIITNSVFFMPRADKLIK